MSVLMAAAIILGWGTARAWSERLKSCHENAIIVFDASGSMGVNSAAERKIEIARQAVTAVLPALARSRPTGLVTYSGGAASTCSDVVLRVPPAHDTSERIIAALAGLEPKGPTAVSNAVRMAADTLERSGATGDIVLVTDGHETCLQSPCDLARELVGRGARVRVHTIGFRLEGPGHEELLCLSRQTGGTHSKAHDLASLREALRRTLSCPRIAGTRGRACRLAAAGPSRQAFFDPKVGEVRRPSSDRQTFRTSDRHTTQPNLHSSAGERPLGPSGWKPPRPL